MGRLDDFHLKLFVDVLIELSKKLIIILPHPDCNADSAKTFLPPGEDLTPVPMHLMADLLKNAVIASEEPS